MSLIVPIPSLLILVNNLGAHHLAYLNVFLTELPLVPHPTLPPLLLPHLTALLGLLDLPLYQPNEVLKYHVQVPHVC